MLTFASSIKGKTFSNIATKQKEKKMTTFNFRIAQNYYGKYTLFVNDGQLRTASKIEKLYFFNIFSDASTASFENAEDIYHIIKCGDFIFDKLHDQGVISLTITDAEVIFDFNIED